MHPRPLFLAWVALSILGGLLIALPDDDARLFSISRDHGPAALDLAGIALLGVGMVAWGAGAWLGRRALPSRDLARLAPVYAAGVALAAWSVTTDAGPWWMLGVAIALSAQAGVAWMCGTARLPND